MKIAIDLGERLLLILLVLPFLISFARYLPTHPYAILSVISECLVVALILIRKRGEIQLSAYAVIIGFAGTALPLFVRPTDSVALVPEMISAPLMLAGLLINISAKVALNRSFGIIAANRGVKRGGPYRFVRHPMYLGYIMTQFGFLMSAWTVQSAVIFATGWLCQILRIREEETVLMTDPGYRAYAAQVPRRLLPGF